MAPAAPVADEEVEDEQQEEQQRDEWQEEQRDEQQVEQQARAAGERRAAGGAAGRATRTPMMSRSKKLKSRPMKSGASVSTQRSASKPIESSASTCIRTGSRLLAPAHTIRGT